MASRLIGKIFILVVILSLCLALVPAPAQAASLEEHPIKFYLDPALVPDMAFARAVLPKYVADMNTILAHNTGLRLVFDPQADILLVTSKPHSDSAAPPLPEDGFEIWAHAVFTDFPYSYGGYAGIDRSGAGVLAGLRWTRLYDPDNLSANGLMDYTIQLSHMLHELAHVFGAGLGEYYSLAQVNDTTGVQPTLDIDLDNPDDPFWSDKPDFMTDPLLRTTQKPSRSQYLQTVHFSSLTAAILDGDYRNGIASFDTITVQVADENGLPVVGATVRVWNVNGNSPYASTLLFEGQTSPTGQVSLAWGGKTDPHNSSNLLRLIKVTKNGVSIAQPRYISIFDADREKLARGQDEYIVTLQPSTTFSETFTAAPGYSGWVRESSQASNKGRDLDASTGVFLLGDDASNRQYRAILSFDTSALPEDAVITGATLKIRRRGLVGRNPFATHGNIIVDIRRAYFSTSRNLQPTDFQAASSRKGVGVIRRSPQAGNWYSTGLAEAAFAAINLQGITQFRLQFRSGDDNDDTADALKFFSAGHPDYAPILVVEYRMP